MDIILIDTLDQYAELADMGVLADLDALINADKNDIGSIDDNVMQLLRKPADGGLFALAPKFDTLALYYNADLFNETLRRDGSFREPSPGSNRSTRPSKRSRGRSKKPN